MQAVPRLIWSALETHGILLKSDTKLPSVTTLVAGEPIRGSWWAHPRAHEIFRILTELADDPDVLLTKLVSGKDTFVHRKLFPAVLAVATAWEPWQLRGLSPEARHLFDRIEKLGELQATGKSALALEQALLVHGAQIHTESGDHAKILEIWERWAKRAKVTAGRLKPDQAKQTLEDALRNLNAAYQGKGKLPW